MSRINSERQLNVRERIRVRITNFIILEKFREERRGWVQKVCGRVYEASYRTEILTQFRQFDTLHLRITFHGEFNSCNWHD